MYRKGHSLTVGAIFERYPPKTCSSPARRAPTSTTRSPTSTRTPTTTSRTRTARPRRCSCGRFQVRWNNIPGNEKPMQPLEVFYTGVYAQDVWQAEGQRLADVRPPVRCADLRRHRVCERQRGRADVQGRERRIPSSTRRRKLPDADVPLVAARRLQLGRVQRPEHAGARRHGHLHGRAGLRLDLEPDRQHRRADGFQTDHNTTARPFSPDPNSTSRRT